MTGSQKIKGQIGLRSNNDGHFSVLVYIINVIRPLNNIRHLYRVSICDTIFKAISMGSEARLGKRVAMADCNFRAFEHNVFAIFKGAAPGCDTLISGRPPRAGGLGTQDSRRFSGFPAGGYPQARRCANVPFPPLTVASLKFSKSPLDRRMKRGGRGRTISKG